MGCIGGAATGNCASGALGAAGSVVLVNLFEMVTQQKASDLTQEQKDVLTGLLTAIIGGTAIALGGDAGVASLAARIEAENNQLQAVVPAVLTLYAASVGNGDPRIGLAMIGRGEDPVSQIVKERIDELSGAIDYIAGDGTSARIKDGFAIPGELLASLIGYIDSKTGGNLNNLWSGLDQDTQAQYQGVAKSVAIGSLAMSWAASIEAQAGGTAAVDAALAKGMPTGTTVVDQGTIGMTWGGGIQAQGLPFEDYIASQLPVGSRLPTNFSTFDFFDSETNTAISVKTLDTSTVAKIVDPAQVYYSLKSNIDAAASFTEYNLGGVPLNSADITARIVQVAVPSSTTADQWAQINKAIQYGQDQGVTLQITVVKP